jgi:hypothetical protein
MIKNNTAKASLPAPIFLHSSSRTSSTWLHNKFRVDRDFYCFFEIFREVLAVLNTEHITENVHDGWQSNHEKMPPYFLEFLPLVQSEGGVKHANSQFMLEGFIPKTGINSELPAPQKTYVQSLIDFAHTQNRKPFMSCTWILGKSGVVQKAFGGTHILLVRDLFTHWCSFAKLYREEHPFMNQMEEALRHNTHDGFIKFLHEYKAKTKKMTNSNMEALMTFIFWHLYLYKEAFDSMDVVVYTGKLNDKAYVKETLAKINAKCGTKMDFDNYAEPKDNLFLVQIEDFELFKDNVDSLFNVMIGKEESERYKFLTQIKNDFLARVEMESKTHKTYIKYANSVLEKSYVRGSAQKMTKMVENAIKLSRPALDQLYHANMRSPVPHNQLPSHLPTLNGENEFFLRDDTHMLLGLNFSTPQEDGVWALEGENAILLNLPEAGVYDLKLRGLYFLPPVMTSPLKLEVFLNNTLIKTIIARKPLAEGEQRRPNQIYISNHQQPQEVDLPNLTLTHTQANFLVLRLSGCLSPVKLNVGLDARPLGFLLRRMFIEKKENALPAPTLAQAPARTFDLAQAIAKMKNAA